MTALTKDLIKLTVEAENNTNPGGRFRQKLHLMPPVGWLNDPNGLCQFKGVYHAFFQYSPLNAEGGVKMWGHYTSRDMIDWEYQGVTLYPDQPFDCSGVYSGCAFIEDGEMYLYYTGNVKLEDRDDYDYVNSGREANTVLVTSTDGVNFGRKRLLMKNSDYPADLTLHVRDPKVWKENGIYYMLQGARTKEDSGQAIVFRSEDKLHWSFHSRIKTNDKFGYMWECPDYFEVDETKILSASVQGLTGDEWKERNVYQSGYFVVDGDILGEYILSDYRLWDYGFDYYAPQSFETDDGRRIQIGWMGMPDCEEYTNRTIEDGWQHCFTFPREVFVKDGIVRQRPIRELEERKILSEETKNRLETKNYTVYEAVVSDISDDQFHAVLAENLIVKYENNRFVIEFINSRNNKVSCGRKIRYVEMDHVTDVRILSDESSVEIFVNDGAYVFSTRYYPEEPGICIEAEGADIRLYRI
ncbi:MAG TPA: glycoside hydrolase family 32 protein [Candidatus Mediterraneibacter faecipullorum]|uniref:Sucrose-6-phosphate hydrolase n=1 Tax=Candidatus Mediterraneibacter faecipullorum TaxID=2838670 RepID=A0A9D2SS80_9FIRM|nr:glycoside hydrolase family 32 protein [Candidatus Mediterraneibacter faecipullorum]